MATPAEPAESLRERKKAQTRAALVEVSQRLFAERGYQATTLEEICEEVGIRPQTLLRYFDSKAQLAMAPWTFQLEVVRRLLERPDRAESTIEVWRAYVRAEAREAMSPSTPLVGNMITNHAAFNAWADKDPILVALNSDLERRAQALLAGALAADLGQGGDPLHATLVAAMLVVGRRAVYERWCAAERRPPSLLDDSLAVIDYALASLPKASARRLVGRAPVARKSVND